MQRLMVVLLLLTTTALPQEPAAQNPATREDVLQLFSVMNINQQMRSIIDSMMKQQKNLLHDTAHRKNPSITEHELDRIDHMMDETIKDFPIDAILDDMVPVYQKHLTKADVSAMSTFYSSPTGQKLLREMPAMTSEAMQASYGRLQKQMEQMTERIDKEMKEEDQQRKSAPKPQSKPVPQSLQN
jgi:uncharacterized protein